ncbi:MAG: DDE-type integrase/transposase/recombinase [Myxococcales bacterium]|nr:DDE-type integrase/transposase/recombinase [Myxococcales bacterium]
MAIWRMNILGPLVSARLDHGDRRALFEEAAARTYVAPDGRPARPSWRTIERWYYAYRARGLDGLEPRPRADRGAQRAIGDEVAEHLLALRRENPLRSIRTLITAMERARQVVPGSLTRSSVARLLRAHGLAQRPRQLPARERRAFTVEHPGDLWMGDGMEGPPVIGPDGRLHTKPRLLSQIDVASRYSIYGEFFVTEDAPHQEIGLRRAVASHGLPREYYVDGGPAYIARSLRTICAELGIRLLHAGPGDAAAKGVIERWHRTWRTEVGNELPARPLHLGELNEIHVAWVTCEYNRRVHGTTGRAPLEHFLAGADNLRPLPRGLDLDDVFLHRDVRKVRQDGTVRWRGGYYEVPGEYVGETVELRYMPLEPARPLLLYVDGARVCEVWPLDRLANNKRPRRELPRPEPAPLRTRKGPLDYIHDEYKALLRAYGEDPDEPDERDDLDALNDQEDR